MFDRRAMLLTLVSCLAAGFAARALVGVAHGEPEVNQDPEDDVEQEDIELVPVRDAADPAVERGPPRHPRFRPHLA